MSRSYSVLFEKAKRTYREEGLLKLVRKGLRFVRRKGVDVAGRVLPVHKLKYLISYSGLLTAAYFYLRGTFRYEKKTILRGQYMYHELEEEQKDIRYRIARNTHLVEKGLSMRERRPVFSERRAVELVDDVTSAWENRESPREDDQLGWSVDVLAKYFEVVDGDETRLLGKARREFETFLDETEYEPGGKFPKPREKLENSSVEYEDLKRLAEQRSSTRWFQDREVPHEKLDKAIEIAAESPSACNRQSFEFKIYDDPELISEILQPPLGAMGFKQNVPTAVVLVGKQRAYFSDEEKNVVFIDASLAAMAFQFALETLGLASCTINWPAVPKENRRMKRLLGLDSDEVIITVMAVGYPDPEGKIPYSAKKNLDELRSYNDTGDG